MKKFIFLWMFVLTFTMISSLFAETQTLVVTGEIRIRPYYSENITDLKDKNPVEMVANPITGELYTEPKTSDDDFEWIEQRARVTVDAELTDGVSARVTVEANGWWGTTSVDDTWDTGLAEGWVKFENIKNTAWSAKVGRQYCHFGRGFLISANDLEVEYDALLLTGDYLPWTINLLYVKQVEDLKDDYDWVYLDVDWSGVESPYALGGYVLYTNDETGADYEPIVVGVRGSFEPTEALSLWGELVYEVGDYGALDISAWAADVGATYSIDAFWTPTVKFNYVFATGDDDPTDTDWQEFDPLFNYTYYGEAFSPAVENIHIINAGVNLKPTEFTTLALDWYYYMQDVAAATVVGNQLLRNPGVTASTNGVDDDLGNEINVGVTHTYTDSVTAKLILAYFMPGDAYMAAADDALEIKGEILVSF